MRDVELRNAVTGQLLETNVVYDMEKGAIEAKWLSANGYYNFYDVASRATKVVREKTIEGGSEGWFSKMLSLIFGVKKCSSRAADNELFGGLDKYLSQTFYLSFNDKQLSEIYVASNLKQDDTCYFKLQILNLKGSSAIRLAPNRGVRITTDNLKEAVKANELSKLRCKVTYVIEDGHEIVITDSMNIVILP
jgi:hypothetical protein